MARKNKKKAPEKSAHAATSEAATSHVDVAFAAGNYAAIKVFARSDPSDKTQKLLELTRIDRVQVAAGLFAMLVVLTVAFCTLHS